MVKVTVSYNDPLAGKTTVLDHWETHSGRHHRESSAAPSAPARTSRLLHHEASAVKVPIRQQQQKAVAPPRIILPVPMVSLLSPGFSLSCKVLGARVENPEEV